MEAMEHHHHMDAHHHHMEAMEHHHHMEAHHHIMEAHHHQMEAMEHRHHHMEAMEHHHHMEAHHHLMEIHQVDTETTAQNHHQALQIVEPPHIIILHQHHLLLQEVVVTTIPHQLHKVAPQHQSLKPRQSPPPLHQALSYLHLHSSLILIHPSSVHARKLLYLTPAWIYTKYTNGHEVNNVMDVCWFAVTGGLTQELSGVC